MPEQDGDLPVEAARTIAFSDAAFPIIMTFLVVEVQRPEPLPGGLAAALLQAWPSYFAFGLAFAHVGVIWLNHHGLFRYVLRVDRGLRWINLGILGTSALIPFPTAVLAHALQGGNLADQRSAVLLYALIAAVMSAAWVPIFTYLERHPQLLTEPAPSAFLRRQRLRPIVGLLAYGAAALVGWYVGPTAALAVFLAMIIYHAATSEGHGHE